MARIQVEVEGGAQSTEAALGKGSELLDLDDLVRLAKKLEFLLAPLSRRAQEAGRER